MSDLHSTICNRWAANAADGGTRHVPQRQASNVGVSDNGDAILSYGWWEMARILRDSKGKPLGFLVNGDIYSVSTSRHQGDVRSAIAATGLRSVIVPYTALDSAGVDKSSITVLEALPDHHSETLHTETRTSGKVNRTTAYATTSDDFGGWQNTLTGEIVLRTERWGSHRPPTTECDHLTEPRASFGPGEWEAYTAAKHLYETHVRINHGVWDEFTRSTRNTGQARFTSGPNGRTDWEAVADDTPEGYHFERTTHRHWLGESLIEAKVSYTANVKCTRCKGVGTADGDTRLTRGAKIGPEFHVDNDRHLDHSVGTMMVDVPTCHGCWGSRRTTVTRHRTAKFLSGFDANETRPSYFFCELPKMSERSVSAAYDALKPTAVIMAEQSGRNVARQGDIFAIPLTAPPAAAIKPANRVKAAYILGTNHKATEVVTHGGLTYIRGTLSHAPADRNPDHRRITIGKGWHLAVKNTVPIAV